jgi:hypothetical protein
MKTGDGYIIVICIQYILSPYILAGYFAVDLLYKRVKRMFFTFTLNYSSNMTLK